MSERPSGADAPDRRGRAPDDGRYGGSGGIAVGEALRALPLERPRRSAWPALQAELSRPPRRHRVTGLLAVAAVLMAALALPRLLAPALSPEQGAGSPTTSAPTTSAPTTSAPTAAVSTTAGPTTAGELAAVPAHAPASIGASTETSSIDALVRESAQLEALLAATQDSAVADGASLLLRSHLRQRLHYVDLLLAAADTDPAARLPLWQERVLLMRSLAGIESGEQLLAARGDAADSPMVLAF